LHSSNRIISSLADEALRVINEAEAKGILLRLMGATALMLHCSRYRYQFERLARNLADLDFTTSGNFRSKLEKFFVEFSFGSHRSVSYRCGNTRHRYFHDQNGIQTLRNSNISQSPMEVAS